MSKYSIDYFIKKFEATDSDMWIIGRMHEVFECDSDDGLSSDRFCALGHCGHKEDGTQTEEGKALGALFGSLQTVTKINDFAEDRRSLPAPVLDYDNERDAKDRILKALKDLKERA